VVISRALSAIGNGLDQAIAVVSPQAALRRTVARRILDRAGRPSSKRFAAANINRLTGDWSPSSSSPNNLLATGGAVIRGRTRQLVRDFPYFSRAAKCLVNYVVGDGMTLQSRVMDASGRIDNATCQKIESAWKRFEKADTRGRMYLPDLERLAKRTECECGEFLLLPRVVRDRSTRSGYRFCLQPIDPDRLTTMTSGTGAESQVWQGVEYNPTTGQVVAYHVGADTSGLSSGSFKSSFQATRILATDIIHGYEDLWADQLRGVTPFVSAILVAHDLSDYMDAEIDAAKMMSKYLAMVTTDDAASFQAGRAETDEDGNKIENLENAMIQYLRPGEDIKFATGSRSATNFEQFTSLLVRMVAVATDLTYELVSGDYNRISYSNLRGIRMDLNRSMRPHQQRQIRQFNTPVFRRWMDWSVTVGDLDLPGYWDDPYHYWECEWFPPGMEVIDPTKESKANESDIGNLLKSPQQIISERGGDWEGTLVQIKQWQDRAKEIGLELPALKKAVGAPVDTEEPPKEVTDDASTEEQPDDE
jgi:lambda family phage portal protein